MASSTRQSLAAAKQALQPLLAKADLGFANQLFAVGQAIAGSAQLRSLLSDPSAEVSAKSGAVAAVFGKSVSAEALGFVTSLVALRWSKGSDLVSALEQLGVFVVANLAAKDGSIENLESEVFAFQSAIEENLDLQFALASKTASAEARAQLVNKLLGGKASANGSALILEAVASSGKRRTSLVLEQYSKIIAQVAEALVAKVTVAHELTPAQLDRLRAALAKTYGSAVKLNVEHDASVVGGVRVQIADQIIDGSVVARLNQAKLSLA
ncbi:MAG: F0F1 ATP synthase subunit delta [Micrococcales bacterium]